MNYREDPLVEVNVAYLYQTDEAIKVEDAEGRQLWIPKTLCGDMDFSDTAQGDEFTLSLPESFATEKGLI